jgi:serine/threonine protein phosphatase PrpC
LFVRCANVGDSHALVVTPTSYYWLTESHRLQDNARERERLGPSVGWARAEDGGPAGPPRLYPGGLACSRSIGDADCPLVSCEPSVCSAALAPDDILIVASDGLWDAMPLQRICRVARETRCAETLLRSKAGAFHDDASVILASAQPAKKKAASIFRVSSSGSISSDEDDPPPRRVFKVSL